MTNPLVSVVVASYNYARYLAEAIDGALAQTYRPLEIVVVDDGSTDGSTEILGRYGDRIRWFGQGRLGASIARNRGIQESRGEFIAMLDSDDFWHPDKLSRQMPLFSDPKVGLVYTGLRYVDSEGRPLGESVDGLEGDVLESLCLFSPPGVRISGSSALIRRSCFEDSGLFDPEIFHSSDWDMWRRIACRHEFRILREPLTYYRQHSASMSHNVPAFERSMLLAFEKTFSDPAAERIHRQRRRCYANLFRILSGGYFQSRDWARFLWFAGRSMAAHPAEAGYFLGTPLRWLARAQSAGKKK